MSKTKMIQVRVADVEKKAWQEAATADGRPLAAWIRLVLNDRACREQPADTFCEKTVEMPPPSHEPDVTGVSVAPGKEMIHENKPAKKLCERCQRLGMPACHACR